MNKALLEEDDDDVDVDDDAATSGVTRAVLETTLPGAEGTIKALA